MPYRIPNRMRYRILDTMPPVHTIPPGILYITPFSHIPCMWYPIYSLNVPYMRFGAIEPPFDNLSFWQRFGNTKFSETTPFRKVDAIGPPLLVVRSCNGCHSGWTAPFLKQTLRKLWWTPFGKFGTIAGSIAPMFRRKRVRRQHIQLPDLALSGQVALRTYQTYWIQ